MHHQRLPRSYMLTCQHPPRVNCGGTARPVGRTCGCLRKGLLRIGYYVEGSPASDALCQSAMEEIISGDPHAGELCEKFRQLDAAGGSHCIRSEPYAPPSREAWMSEIVDSLPFEVDLRYPYKRHDHINILEAQSRLSIVKMISRSRHALSAPLDRAGFTCQHRVFFKRQIIFATP